MPRLMVGQSRNRVQGAQGSHAGTGVTGVKISFATLAGGEGGFEIPGRLATSNQECQGEWKCSPVQGFPKTWIRAVYEEPIVPGEV